MSFSRSSKPHRNGVRALFIRHHGDIVQSVEVRQSLHVGLVFDQLLGTTVKQSDMRIRADDLFTIDLENQSKHTVSSRMLRTEVDCVVTDFAADPFTRCPPGE